MGSVPSMLASRPTRPNRRPSWRELWRVRRGRIRSLSPFLCFVSSFPSLLFLHCVIFFRLLSPHSSPHPRLSQVDNCLPVTAFPILFSFAPSQKEEPVVHLTICKAVAYRSMDYYRYVALRLQECACTFDERKFFI